MIKKDNKYIFLNTFRPEVNILSSEAKMYHYMIGNKVYIGNFVVYSSRKNFKPLFTTELTDDDLSLNDIKPIINSDEVYLPIYLRDKIGNARKKGNEFVKETIRKIVAEYDKYYNLYKEDELYNIISIFFDSVYEEIVKIKKENNFKIEFSVIAGVKPIFTDGFDKKNKNSELLNSCYYLSNDFLKQLSDNKIIKTMFSNLIGNIGTLYTIDFNLKEISEVQSIRNSTYNLFYTLGLPYIINSELGDTVHLKNDFMANCYDSFIKIGILIEMIKKINYPIDTDKYKEVLSLTNLPKNIDRNNLENLLKDIIVSEYEFVSKITNIENKEVTISFGTDTKRAMSINNILDFYYHFFFNHLEDKSFMKALKKEEINKYKKTLKKESSRNKKDSYIRQLKQQKINYQCFKK